MKTKKASFLSSFVLLSTLSICSSANAEDTWTKVANEYQFFTLTSAQTVRFGTGTKWVQKTVVGKKYCSVGSFGSDPAYGLAKQCQVLSSVTTPPVIPPVTPPVTPPVDVSLSPGCKTFYSSTFLLSSTKEVAPLTAMAKPHKAVSFAEPNYGTCLTRTTDFKNDGVSGFARNDYSRRQAFNVNNTLQLVYALDGSWHVYDTNSHSHVKRLSGPAADAELQWDPAKTDTLYYIPTSGIGMKLYELNVTNNTSKVLVDFSSRLKAKWPGAMAAWTRNEGSPSKDGRYWCFMVDNNDWNSVGVFTWDKQTDTILGYFNTNGDRPDHVSMSPTGDYCVISGDGPKGTSAYSRDFSSSKKLLHNSQHSDLALDANGKDIYVSIDYSTNEGEVFMTSLETGVRTKLFATYIDGTGSAFHFSGKGYNKPGWVVVTSYASGGGSAKWLHEKVFAVQLKANPKTYNLAYHRSIYNEYWTAPVASVNRDFSRIVFNSNWRNNSKTDVDTYSIEISPDFLKN